MLARRWSVRLTLVCVLGIGGASLRAQTFSFVEVASTSDGLSSFSLPSLNDAGTAAFSATHASGRAIYTGNGGAIDQLLTTSPGGFASLGDVSINDVGAIGFVGVRAPSPGSPQAGVYRLGGGSVTTIAENPDDTHGYFSPAVNNAGRVAFNVEINFIAGGPIFVGYGDGTAPATLLEGAGHPHYYAVTMATLNAGGDPAFAGRYNPPPNEQRHLRYRGHDVATGFSFHGTDINDADRIVFAAGDGSADRVYLTDATGAVHTPVLAARASAVAINNAGLLAALLLADGSGPDRIVFGPTLATPVIAVNDPLFGSTVTSLGLSNQGFNDEGQIAFAATLADGRSGVFVATVVPECASVTVVLCGASALVRRRR
jgi:hypothetical protein